MNHDEDPIEPAPWDQVTESPRGPEWVLLLAVGAAAIIGRLPALGAWWNQDDWGLLARAAGVAGDLGASGLPARLLSQHLWWDLTWPLFGLDPVPHAWSRLLLYALSAVFIVRIAARAGLTSLGRLVAGLLFAATPLAFTPLYWAAGVQELLAVLLAVISVERWLAGGRQNLLLAFLAAVASMLAKEAGLALPLFFTALLWAGIGPSRDDRAFAWALTLLLLLAAVAESALVLTHFATGPDDPYATGGVGNALGNLGVFGWWMISPGPILASRIHWPMAVGGGLLFVLWAIWGVGRWRQGLRLPLLALGAALLSLLPALPLVDQIHPYLALLAFAAGALTLASSLPRRWSLGPTTMILLTLLAVAWGFFGMRTRAGQRDAQGLPADPVVRATALSWNICRVLPDLPLERDGSPTRALTILQPTWNRTTAEMAARLGDRWVTGSSLYHALGGGLALRLMLAEHGHPNVRVDWVNALTSNPVDALVLCEAGTGFKHWGRTGNALFYAALTDVGLGQFERARRHLVRAGAVNDETVPFAWDPDQMVVPLQAVLDNRAAFIDWMLLQFQEGRSGHEVGGVQDIFFNLLSTCTGQSVEALSAGSTFLRRRVDDPAQTPVETPGRPPAQER